MSKGIINKRGVKLESRGSIGACLTGPEKGKLGWGLGRLGAYRAAFEFLLLPCPNVFRKLHQALSWTDTNNTVQHRGVSCVRTPEYDLNPQRSTLGSQALKTEWQQAVSKGIPSDSEPGIRALPHPHFPAILSTLDWTPQQKQE